MQTEHLNVEQDRDAGIAAAGGHRPYCVNTEGTEHPWPRDTITTEEIAELGGWDVTLGVIEVDRDNNERTLQPGEVVQLRPGHGFCRKIRFKRGFTHGERIAAEVALLRKHYPNLEFKDGWIRILRHSLPGGWNPRTTDVVFQITASHPGTPPYGIYVPVGLRIKGATPKNYTEPASTQPPFGGEWGVFSWTVEPSDWRPTVDLASGTNLLAWVRSFARRFEEGV